MIGIIGAMKSEIELVKASLSDVSETIYAGMTFYTGKLGAKDIVLAQSGMGKVNIAICAQVMIDIFKADALINTGIAGGIAHGLHVGDVVIGKDAVQHDYDLTPVGYAMGHVDFGDTDKEEPVYFKSSDRLVELIYGSAKDLMNEENIHIRTIATGDIFVSRNELKDELRERYDAYAAEMEGGAMLHVANKNGVEAVIIRCISDLADEGAGESIENFGDMVANRSAQMLIETIKRL